MPLIDDADTYCLYQTTKDGVLRLVIDNGGEYDFTVEGKSALVFTSPTCGGCKRVKASLAQKSLEDWEVYIVDTSIEENLDLAAEFEITSLPYIVLFQDSVKVGEIKSLKDYIAQHEMFGESKPSIE